MTAPTSAIRPIAASDVAIAGRSPKCASRISSGTTTIPPPTPKSALKSPATRPMTTSRTAVFCAAWRMAGAARASPAGRPCCSTSTGRSRRSSRGRSWPRCPRRRAPRCGGSPARYALVACVSGRTGEEARAARRRRRRRLRRRPRARARARGRALARARCGRSPGSDWPWLEDKGLTVAFHWREAPDEEEARAELEAVAERARAAGLEARWGRKVLELRPPVDGRQGHRGARAARRARARAGALRGRRHDRPRRLPRARRLELAVRVAVASPEGPPELREAADLVVGSPAELLELLRTL